MSGERTRAAVGVVGWVGLACATAGVVLLVTGAVGAGVVASWLGVALGVACLVHGRRYEHERGRAAAVVALCVGIVVGSGGAYARWWGSL